MPEVIRRECRGQGQTDLPAEQSPTGACARIPTADAYPRRPRHRVGPAHQGPAFADCLSTGSATVLPAQYRLRRSIDFGATVKRGRRAAQPHIVIHARRTGAAAVSDESALGAQRHPMVGLIIAKSVGSAVQRHQVARRLRHVAREVLGELEPGEQVVIRALPGSSAARSAQLEQQLRAGLQLIHRARGA